MTGEFKVGRKWEKSNLTDPYLPQNIPCHIRVMIIYHNHREGDSQGREKKKSLFLNQIIYSLTNLDKNNTDISN